MQRKREGKRKTGRAKLNTANHVDVQPTNEKNDMSEKKKNDYETSKRDNQTNATQVRPPAKSKLVPQSASRTTTTPEERTKEHGE